MNANIYVSDLSGRTVRHLLRGGVLGTQGAMTWDGTDEGGQRCRQGRYLLTVEVYNTEGKRQRTKRAVTVVSSF
jgi:flagellar hook assembly protein FlgD